MNGENNNKNDFEKPDSSLNNGENRDNNGQYYNERENFNPYGSFDSRYQNAPYGGYNPAPIGNKRNEVKVSKTPVIILSTLFMIFAVAVTAVLGVFYFRFLNTPDTGNGGNSEGIEDAGGTGSDNGGDVIDSSSLDGILQPDFKIEQALNPGTEYEELEDAVEATEKTVVAITTFSDTTGVSGAGSGVIIGRMSSGKGYYIITNNHVVEDATKITVELYDGTKYSAYESVLKDEQSDLAIIAIAETKELAVAKVGSSEALRTGQDIFVIGNPLGTLGGTVTNGIVSAEAVNILVSDHYMQLIQTNAAINPGNSGGGMFNMSGELVGIVNAKYESVSVEGIGFAIPIDTAVTIAEQMVSKGYIEGRHNLGIQVEYGTQSFISGNWITSVDSDSALYKAGFEFNKNFYYKINSINGKTFNSTAEINNYIDNLKAGESVSIEITEYVLSGGFMGYTLVENKTVTLNFVLEQQYIITE